jgi:PIN domain nuclease of toxin-antitoxin system
MGRMSYLLDTHIILWLAENSAKLTQPVKMVLTDQNIEKYVSIVSAWEVEIKLAIKKLAIEGGIDEFFRIIEENGFELIGVEKEFVQQLAKLPLHHSDPFDRMLIATSLAENMTLVSADRNIHQYDVQYLS